MSVAIKQTVTIQPGGVVHLASPELRAGAQAEVFVLVTDSSEDPAHRLAAFQALQQSLALTPAAANAWTDDAAANRTGFGPR